MPLWLADQPLVLASKSAVRRAVLEMAGIPLAILPADIDERGIEARADAKMPAEVAALLAREKARAVAAGLSGRLVLGADQTLGLGVRSFTKPADRPAARAQLLALRGRTHELIRSRGSAFSCSIASRAITSPFSVCRCCRY